MQNVVTDSLRNWVPYKLANENGSWICQWLYTKNQRFTDPFFEETRAKCLHFAENSSRYRSVTTVEALEEWASQIDAVYPTAFIFHVSRCGSTLLSQALGLNSKTISLSEVPLFDQVLRLPESGHKISDDSVGKLLTASIGFYGAKRTSEENRLFIKADSWHLLLYKKIRDLYPEIPFILLYRNPDDVLRSHKRKRGIQGIPGMVVPGLLGIDKQECFSDLDNYMALVLEKFFDCMLEMAESDSNAHLFNYSDGLMSIMHRISKLTGMELSPEEEVQIKERESFHAKYPGERFAGDGATPAFSAPVASLNEKYDRLNVIKQQKLPDRGVFL